MMNRLMMGLCPLAVLATGLFAANADSPQTLADKGPIKTAMAKAFKGPLIKTVAGGDATDEEKAELVKLMKGMAEATPKKGDKQSWAAKTKALVAAAEAAAEGKDGAAAMLKKAANCKACHSVHK